MRSRLVTVAVATLACAGASCRQLFGLHPVDDRRDGAVSDGDGGGDGGSADAAPDADVSPRCVGSGMYEVCLNPSPAAPIKLAGAIATDSPCATTARWTSSQQPAQTCFVVGTDITIDAAAMVVATGTRPLVLVATRSITIAGALDVSSYVASADHGAGANASDCSPSLVPTAGGGAGGSFITAGGNGGHKLTDGDQGIAAAADASAPAKLRGGCRGQDNGGGTSHGGAGGGAVYLVAGALVSISGSISAGGAGGAGGAGSASPSGGGGGTGGMIALFAPTILANGATLIANGGGGGGGGNAGSASGQDGGDGKTSGSGGAYVVTGGGGYTQRGPAGTGASVAATGVGGGGGGGGGAGFIGASVPLAGATSSPPAGRL